MEVAWVSYEFAMEALMSHNGNKCRPVATSLTSLECPSSLHPTTLQCCICYTAQAIARKTSLACPFPVTTAGLSMEAVLISAHLPCKSLLLNADHVLRH